MPGQGRRIQLPHHEDKDGSQYAPIPVPVRIEALERHVSWLVTDWQRKTDNLRGLGPGICKQAAMK
jgi:hypothetical protein